MNYLANYNRPATLADWFLNDGFYGFSAAPHFSPRADIYSDEKKYYLELELPGLEKKDVKVEVENQVLKIEGTYKETEGKFLWFKKERPTGKISAEYKLGREIDAGSIKARMEHGVLHLEFAKTPAAVARKIEVA
jgi:HSP20 family protein